MKRLYWSWILSSTKHNYNARGWHCKLVVDYEMHLYEADTLEDLYKTIKADGWQIRGYQDYLDDYSPWTALEYLMLRDILLARGISDEEIANDYLFDAEYAKDI